MKTHSTHFAGLDFFLAMAAVAVISWMQLFGPFQFRGVPSLLVPVIYLVATKLLAGTRLAAAAGRAYLLCFFLGLVGSSLAFQDFLRELAINLARDDFELHKSFRQALAEIEYGARHILRPLLTGIAIYVACSVFDDADAEKPIPRIDFSNLEMWIAACDAPDAVKKFLCEIKTRVTELQTAYGQLSNQTDAARAHIAAAGQAAQGTRAAFAELASTGHQLTSELAAFRKELVTARAQLDQLHAAVHESQQVVDEFADIASRNILK